MARIEGDETTVALRQGRVLVREAPARTRSRARPDPRAPPAVFGGYARMELGQDKAKSIPAIPKMLAQIRVATLIGCPF